MEVRGIKKKVINTIQKNSYIGLPQSAHFLTTPLMNTIINAIMTLVISQPIGQLDGTWCHF